jgi:hypothetical protein
LDELRHGGSPTITKGPHAGEGIALDHVLPRSILPELAAKLFNLGAITAKDNRAKSAKITAGELKLARQWNREGLLSLEGLAAVGGSDEVFDGIAAWEKIWYRAEGDETCFFSSTR